MASNMLHKCAVHAVQQLQSNNNNYYYYYHCYYYFIHANPHLFYFEITGLTGIIKFFLNNRNSSKT